MRHRITSFRCVIARQKMSRFRRQNKTCSWVKYRQTLWLRAGPRTSGAAILNHSRNFGPGRHDERRLRADREADPSAAADDRIEQWIVGREVDRESPRGGIEAGWHRSA